MHRFFLPDPPEEPTTLVLSGDEASHASKVLRVKTGEEVMVLDGKGRRFLTCIDNLARKELHLRVLRIEQVPPPHARLTLFQAVTKPKSMEWIVEKATELGAFCIQPVLSERVVTRISEADRGRKVEKWRRTAVEALKQCGNAWLPAIHPPLPIPAVLSDLSKGQVQLLASLSPTAEHVRDALANAADTKPAGISSDVGIWVGPEGDFTTSEAAQLDRAGAIPITLGRQVLRSETAAVAALAMTASELEYHSSHLHK